MKGARCGRQTIGRSRIAEFSIGRACPRLPKLPPTQSTWGLLWSWMWFCPALCTCRRTTSRLIYSQRGYKSRENCRSFRNTPFPPLPLRTQPSTSERDPGNEECAMNGLVGCLTRSFISGVATLLPIRKKAQRPTSDAGGAAGIRDAIDIRSQPR